MVKDGYKFAAAPLLVGVVAVVLHWNLAWRRVDFPRSFCNVFLSRSRKDPAAGPDTIVSPADGRVMEVVEESRDGKPGRRDQRVSLDFRCARQPFAGGRTHHRHRVSHRQILRGHARPGIGRKRAERVSRPDAIVGK